jgi:hypothetical protein
MPVSELSAPLEGLYGNPGWILKRNDGRQFPPIALTFRLANRGTSYTNEYPG